MNRTVSAMLLSGSLLAGAGVPQSASAHGSDEFVGFVAGAAVGYLFSEAIEDDDGHHHHRYRQAFYGPGYGVPAPAGYYAVPAPVVRHYHVVEPPIRYYDRAPGHGRWGHNPHGRRHR